VGTPVANIIARAYREANITALGAMPTAAQQNEGLDNLNSFMSLALGQDLGEPLYDWLAPRPQRTAPVAANWPQGPWGNPDPLTYPNVNVTPFPNNNARIVWGGQTQTIYFPENPNNGGRVGLVQGSGKGDHGTPGDVLTLDGNGRYVNAPGTSLLTFTFSNSAPAAGNWIYVAATGMWVSIGALALTDILLFPPDYDDYWITGLAGRLAPKYNKSLSAETQAAFLLNQTKVRAEFRQPHDTVYGSDNFPNTLQAYNAGRWLFPFPY